ncbi:hypothetical protein PGS1_13067 [Enterobacter cloacae subsp. cloacae GS1]|nr:hypothetical protein PGS1_13067 [Enterobacter cloacae subsp. cloacae GS1]
MQSAKRLAVIVVYKNAAIALCVSMGNARRLKNGSGDCFNNVKTFQFFQSRYDFTFILLFIILTLLCFCLSFDSSRSDTCDGRLKPLINLIVYVLACCLSGEILKRLSDFLGQHTVINSRSKKLNEIVFWIVKLCMQYSLDLANVL